MIIQTKNIPACITWRHLEATQDDVRTYRSQTCSTAPPGEALEPYTSQKFTWIQDSVLYSNVRAGVHTHTLTHYLQQAYIQPLEDLCIVILGVGGSDRRL